MKKVLVLGSHGLIGKALVKKLTKENCECIKYDILMGKDFDLTKTHECKTKNNLTLAIEEADFIFFLAYDVGGSKYLEKTQSNFDFISNNSMMMKNVFSAINNNKEIKPFIFASSMMAEMPYSTYGSLKKLGEMYTKTLKGVSVRFWNVFGKEEFGLKSHIVTDLIYQYYNKLVYDKHVFSDAETIDIELLTDGSEFRQFISADKAAEALICVMHNYDNPHKYFTKHEDKSVVDVSSGEWTNIHSLSNKILNAASKAYEKYLNTFAKEFNLIKGGKKDLVQKNNLIEPNLLPIVKMGWNPYEDIDEELYKIAWDICCNLGVK